MKREFAIAGLDSQDIGSLLFVGTYKYYCLMVKQLMEGRCPFCQVDTTLNNILYQNASWMTWVNPVPGKRNQELHLVIPCKRHITHIGQLTGSEGADLTDILVWASNEFKIRGGGFMMRFGDPALNAGTIRHLHGNIQVPSGTGKLEITLAKDPEKIESHWRRVTIFEKMRLGTPFEQLPDEDRAFIAEYMG